MVLLVGAASHDIGRHLPIDPLQMIWSMSILDGARVCGFGRQFPVQSLCISMLKGSYFFVIYLLAHASHGKRQL